jgi:hypothetical protein
MLVAPDPSPLVQPGGAAVGVVPVSEQDRCDPDLLADRAFELLAYLGCSAGGIARVHDDPALRGLEGEAARHAPALQVVHAVGDLLRDLRLCNTEQRIGFELRLRRYRAVGCGDRLHGERWTVPGMFRLAAAGDNRGIDRANRGQGLRLCHVVRYCSNSVYKKGAVNCDVEEDTGHMSTGVNIALPVSHNTFTRAEEYI